MTEDETYCIEGTDLLEKDICDIMESVAKALTSGNLADASFHIDCALNRDGYAQRNPGGTRRRHR